MGSGCAWPCIYCMFVSCVHPVAFVNAAFCMTCSLLMLVEDARGDHMEYKPNTPTQHGYKTQHSTVTALHTLKNTIAKGFNQMAHPARTITVALI